MAASRTLIKGVAAAVDVVRRPAAGVTVLIYHRVGGRTPVPVDLPSHLFDAQVGELAATGRVVTLDDAIEILAGTRTVDFDPVVLTFDDGTADFVDEAVPILARHGVPATLYVATRYVDEGIDFPDDGHPASWAGLADALSTGVVTIGSHTHSHALLDRLPTREVGPELDRSRELIAEHLGVEAHHFAYPKALAGSPAAAGAVAERFRSAALAGTRVNPVGATDPQRLWRSPIQVTDGMRWFRRKAAGGLSFEDDLRRGINRWRYRGAAS